jgi:chromosome segregation ATPase
MKLFSPKDVVKQERSDLSEVKERAEWFSGKMAILNRELQKAQVDAVHEMKKLRASILLSKKIHDTRHTQLKESIATLESRERDLKKSSDYAQIAVKLREIVSRETLLKELENKHKKELEDMCKERQSIAETRSALKAIELALDRRAEEVNNLSETTRRVMEELRRRSVEHTLNKEREDEGLQRRKVSIEIEASALRSLKIEIEADKSFLLEERKRLANERRALKDAYRELENAKKRIYGDS